MSGLTKNIIEERKDALTHDITEVNKALAMLEKQKNEQIALLNALQGAVQQCNDFLQDERVVGETELDNASSDVENSPED